MSPAEWNHAVFSVCCKAICKEARENLAPSFPCLSWFQSDCAWKWIVGIFDMMHPWYKSWLHWSYHEWIRTQQHYSSEFCFLLQRGKNWQAELEMKEVVVPVGQETTRLLSPKKWPISLPSDDRWPQVLTQNGEHVGVQAHKWSRNSCRAWLFQSGVHRHSLLSLHAQAFVSPDTCSRRISHMPARKGLPLSLLPPTVSPPTQESACYVWQSLLHLPHRKSQRVVVVVVSATLVAGSSPLWDRPCRRGWEVRLSTKPSHSSTPKGRWLSTRLTMAAPATGLYQSDHREAEPRDLELPYTGQIRRQAWNNCVNARRWLSTTEFRRFLLTMQRCCFGTVMRNTSRNFHESIRHWEQRNNEWERVLEDKQDLTIMRHRDIPLWDVHAVDIIFARAQDVLSVLNQSRNKAVVTSRFSNDDLTSNETKIACIKSSRIRMQVFSAQRLRLTAACIDCLCNNSTFVKAKTRT